MFLNHNQRLQTTNYYSGTTQRLSLWILRLWSDCEKMRPIRKNLHWLLLQTSKKRHCLQNQQNSHPKAPKTKPKSTPSNRATKKICFLLWKLTYIFCSLIQRNNAKTKQIRRNKLPRSSNRKSLQIPELTLPNWVRMFCFTAKLLFQAVLLCFSWNWPIIWIIRKFLPNKICKWGIWV